MNTTENSGHKMTIDRYNDASDPNNSYCEPVGPDGKSSPQAYADATPAGQPAYYGDGSPVLGPDGKQLMGTGKGSDTHLAFNPDLYGNNPLDPSNPEPNDSVLAHEWIHGSHEMTGKYDGTPVPGWDTQEEKNTILTGHPSEADYLRQAGYPYHRTSHGGDSWERNT
jgi:hypothetical protein